MCRIVNEQEHREGVEPPSPHYESGIFATGLSVQSIASVGPEGLEPSLGGLRVRCAAANTLIPFSPLLTRREWARRESNPQSDPYKRPALTVELRAASGAERTRTFTFRIKSPVCSRYTTTPECRPGVCVSIVFGPCSCSLFPVVALRVELSTTRLSAVSGRPALDYHLPTSLSIQSGWQDSNLRSCAPKAHGFAATLHPVNQSERADLNRRSPGPRPGAMPGFATFCSK